MPAVSNGRTSLEFADGPGVSLVAIRDERTGYNMLPDPTMLFLFAVNNRTAYGSDAGLRVDGIARAADGSTLRIMAHTTAESTLNPAEHLAVSIAVSSHPAALIIRVTFTNTGAEHISLLRTVLPRVHGITPKGGRDRALRTVPAEMGVTCPASSGIPIGMPLDLSLGLPASFNAMEFADVYDAGGNGGVFFADVDGDLDSGVSPLQFRMTGDEVAAFWTCGLSPGASVTAPGLAIGVHDGDWHAAADVYASLHPARPPVAESPAWLREEGAIYTFAGGGAGSIYLDQPGTEIVDRAIWVTRQPGRVPWHQYEGGRDLYPVAVSRGGAADPLAPIAAATQDDGQLDVFWVGDDGAVWVTWETGQGRWRDGLDGHGPERITPPGYARPGAHVVAARQAPDQLDVFWIGEDGAVWVSWETAGGGWRDGVDGRGRPARVTPEGYGLPGAPLAAARQAEDQLDVFWIGHSGAVWVTWAGRHTAWTDGAEGRPPPAPVTPAGFATPGGFLAAEAQTADQLDVFWIHDGAIWVTWSSGLQLWTDGLDGRGLPQPITPSGSVPAASHLVAARQTADQLNVFWVHADGAIWTSWVSGAGGWTDGRSGRAMPVPVTPSGLAPAGARLATAVKADSELEVLWVGHDGGMWATWQESQQGWQDGRNGRGTPVQITPPYFAVPGAYVTAAAQSAEQLDVFAIRPGRLGSFRDLPRLLEEARRFGTSVVYLWDYWEAAPESVDPAYWNKGDYIPRGALGGAPALIDGIRAIHDAGGWVLAYLEPFIIYDKSMIAQRTGGSWTATIDGTPPTAFVPFFRSPAMLPSFGPWVEHVVATAERLVGHYGFDGVFLDSVAWRMNFHCGLRGEPGRRPTTSLEYSAAMLALVDRVRVAVRAIKPHAVVIGETTAGPIAAHWDGGLAADFSHELKDTSPSADLPLLGSPVRAAYPHVTMFSNGRDLNGLHQVFAAGHGLALNRQWPDDARGHAASMLAEAAHIRDLVTARQHLKDALVYGQQQYQPQTGDPGVISYRYRGDLHHVITIVNIDPTPHAVDLQLRGEEEGRFWSDVVDPSVAYLVTDGALHGVAMAPTSIRVLVSPAARV